MATLEQVRRQLEGVHDLEAITRAMKALAAVRIRQAREAVESLNAYRDNLERGLQVALRDRRPGAPSGERRDEGPLAMVVFGSDLGLAGAFNARVADFAVQRLDELEPDAGRRIVLAVGGRLRVEMETLGTEVALALQAPANVEAVVGTVRELLLEIERLRVERDVHRVSLVYSHYRSGMAYRPHLLHLLPIDGPWLAGLESREWNGPSIPAFRIGWERLFSALIQEHLFVSLFGAGAESHASEHASRLAAMEAAEDRIEDRLRELTGSYQRRRQERVTAELQDLVAGFEALEGGRGREDT